MSDSTEGLGPPKDPKQDASNDPGARQLAEHSDSDDQFTDAQSAPQSPQIASPIPTTRVEKVDSTPSHGEVVGTEAYAMRTEDAQPDEVTILPPATSSTPSTYSVPTTVVETSPGETAAHSDEYEAKRKADADPDVVMSSEEKGRHEESFTTVTSQAAEETSPTPVQASPTMSSDGAFDDNDKEEKEQEDQEYEEDKEEPDFADDHDGDDFDDFEEGGEGDDDFDDFEDGFQQVEPTPPPVASPLPEADLPFSIPDFVGMSSDDILSATEPHLISLFPPEDLNFSEFPPHSKDTLVFATPRSASLWSQLVAPPPLAPPDWIRSRTRRLFLVSLGVPVDLDEILPASKQKKLVLPSLNIPGTSPRASTETRSLSRVRQGEGNGSSTSVDTQGKPSKAKGRKGPPSAPDFDLVSARLLCSTTGEALDGMTDDELKTHVEKLDAMQNKATELLEYWQKRADEKIGDREAFEGVIENLVKHARKVRK